MAVESEKPSAGLVDAFSDEVGGEEVATVESLLVFKGVMDLGIGHRTGVKPHVDQVGLAVHGLAGGEREYDVVDIGTVEVDTLIVFLGVIAGHKTALAIVVGRHEAGLYGAVDLVEEGLHGVDADLFGGVVGAPDGERSAPKSGSVRDSKS